MSLHPTMAETVIPPPGTPPAAYLAAVLAVRRGREQARLATRNPAFPQPGPTSAGGDFGSGGPAAARPDPEPGRARPEHAPPG
jgi:hypothetical protein